METQSASDGTIIEIKIEETADEGDFIKTENEQLDLMEPEDLLQTANTRSNTQANFNPYECLQFALKEEAMMMASESTSQMVSNGEVFESDTIERNNTQNNSTDITIDVDNSNIKEENKDGVVSYDYPTFDDAESMDSNDATALGNVEACLQDEINIKSENEGNYEMSRYILDLDKDSEEEYDLTMYGVCNDQAENSDIGGDSDPEDPLKWMKKKLPEKLFNPNPPGANVAHSITTSSTPFQAQPSEFVPSPYFVPLQNRVDVRLLKNKEDLNDNKITEKYRCRLHAKQIDFSDSEDNEKKDEYPDSESGEWETDPLDITNSSRQAVYRPDGIRTSARLQTKPLKTSQAIERKRHRPPRKSRANESNRPFRFRKSFRTPPEYRGHKFTTHAGINFEVDLSSPLQIFMLFFTEDIFENILEQTNLYSNHKLNLCMMELQAFFGMLIIMGFHVLPTIRHYWSTDPNFTCPRISGLMTLKRFLRILKYFHLNDNSTMKPRDDPEHDKLHKVRPLLKMLSENFRNVFTPSRFLNIAESKVPVRSRALVKEPRRGLKVWALCCSVTGYMSCLDIYSGVTPESGAGEEAVLRLTQAFSGLGFCVFFNHFFNSLTLLTKLLARKIFACGMLRETTKHFPKECLIEDKRLALGEFDSVMDGSISVTKWKCGRKCVIMGSNMHSGSVIRSAIRTNPDGKKERVRCPKSVADYHAYKDGVDKFDQLMSAYTVSWKSRRWWMKIFYYLLDCAIVNSYIVYRNVAEEVLPPCQIMSHVAFRSKLADELISDYSNWRSKFMLSERPNFDGAVPHFPEKTTCKRCAYCSSKKRQVRSSIGCDVCKVSLCPMCFKDYHLNDCKKKSCSD